MPTILLVEKSGTIRELATKTLTVDDLYKKAGFKSKEGFEIATIWSEIVDGKPYVISLFGKTEGRAGQENKYDFPPPMDNVLFFGTCVLICHDENGQTQDFTKNEWVKIYEYLFGGFEDLDDEEEEEASEDDSVEKELPRTKEGYVKDGFIVDDVIEDAVEEEDEEEDEDDEVESTEEEDDEVESTEEEEEDEDEDEEDFAIDEDGSDSGKKSKKPVKKTVVVKKPIVVATKKPAAKPKKDTARTKSIQKIDSGNYLNCSDELKEETYI